jgi:hypothetical protein
MKKISILFLLIVFSLTKANSQEKNFFSLDIFALLSGALNISFEKATASFVGLNYELNAKVGYVW